jgi:hypothetical protein
LLKICERYRKTEKVDTLYSVLFGDVVREGIAIFARIVGKGSVAERVSGRKF